MTTIANLTDGVTANATDRLPVERSPFGTGTNRYITPAYLATYLAGTLTADRVVYGQMSQSANLTFDGTTLATTRVSIAAGTLTTDVRGFNLTATMNAAAVTFTGSLWTFTEGPSGTAAGTLLHNIKYGTSGAEASVFSVSKTGTVEATRFNPTSSSLSGSGMCGSGGTLLFTSGGVQKFYVNSGGGGVYSGVLYMGSSGDAGFSRLGAASVALGNGSASNASGTLSLATVNFGASGTLGKGVFGNATSGTITLQPVTGALGTVTLFLPAATDTLVGKATTDTLTNKRMTARNTATTGNAPTWNSDNCDQLTVTSITGAINIGTNMTLGTHSEGDELMVCLTDDGTGRAITWGSNFESSGTTQGTLPTTTVASTKLTVGFRWNGATSKFRCAGSA